MHQGDCRTNVPEDGRNAVTWGIFPGQEVVQTTIIERESFLAWKVLFLFCLLYHVLRVYCQDDAFSIWSEWASFYRPESEERKLLEGIRDNRWLVSIVHHDYKDSEGLWTFLLDDKAETVSL